MTTTHDLGRSAVPDRDASTARPLPRPAVARARRVVIKVGTRALLDSEGALAEQRLAALVATVAALVSTGRAPTLVSSGAVGLGRHALGLLQTPRGPMRRVCAAVGQARLAERYRRCFQQYDRLCGQVLVSRGDLRGGRSPVAAVLNALLEHGTVPVVNGNDVTGAQGRAQQAGTKIDNDELAGRVARAVGADLLVLLTDVEGVYDSDPRRCADARLLSTVEGDVASGMLGEANDDGVGCGGMRSKVSAALAARSHGCQSVIASGHRPGALSQALAGDAIGTWFPASQAHRRSA